MAISQVTKRRLRTPSVVPSPAKPSSLKKTRKSQTPEAPESKQALETSPTHRPLGSSFLGLPYRILNTYHKKELLVRAYG